MKRLAVLIATTILCEIVIGQDFVRRRRGYYDHHHYSDVEKTMDDYEHFNHPPWWPTKHMPNKPHQHHHYGSFGTHHGGSSEEESINKSGEETDRPRDPIPKNKYGMGGGGNWWRPWSTSRKPMIEYNSTVRPSQEALISSCIQSCSVTYEYEPVCGSNNVTYLNPGQLQCEQKCGVPVTMSGLNACPVFNPWANTTSSIKREIIVACLRKCPSSVNFSPVCGTNNMTYENAERLICERNCGINVALYKPYPCRFEVIMTEKTVTTEENIAICIRNCPVTGEFNPVCGSNNITYSNPGRLECAQNCGVEVKLVRNTSCIAPLTDEELKKNQLATSTEPTLVNYTTTTTTTPYVNGNENNDFSTANDENFGNDNDEGIKDNRENDPQKEINKNNENSDSNTEASNVDNAATNDANGITEDTNEGNDSDSLKEENQENGESRRKPGHKGEGHKDQSNYHGNQCNSGNSANLNDVMACMQLCTLTPEYNPVCGNDGITYTNPGRLLCAQFCGTDVRVTKFAPCSSESLTNNVCVTQPLPTTVFTNPPVTDQPITTTKTTPITTTINIPITTTITIPITTPNPTQSCMESCPASLEYQPVCGSNNVTYRNKEVLQCARRCGLDVTYASDAECSLEPATVKPPVWNSTNIPNTPEEIQACIQLCSVDDEYAPLCGSDDITYNNTAHVICARQCGIPVLVKKLTPCSEDDDVNIDDTPTTNPTPSEVTPNNGVVNFTIPAHILDSIWPELTTPSDEDFDLDQRVQGS